MDHRFLQYYERELRYVRELGAEFAQRFPKVAGRLGLSELACADPHVERLLQGFAFMTGRVHMALDAEFSAFPQQLTELAYRSCLAPTPSMTVVQFGVDSRSGSLAEGFTVPRDTALRALTAARDGTACEFRTAHAVELLPISVERVEYTSVLRGISTLRVPTREPIKALLTLHLRSHNMRFDRLRLSTLPLFLRGCDETSARLYEQLITSATSLVMRWGPDASQHVALATDAQPVRALGFDAEHALLPRAARSFEGYRLLQEYFAFPARFDFVELTGLAAGAARCTSDRLELIVPLTRFDPALEGTIDAGRVVLFATPAVNLFPVDCGRLPVPKNQHELQVVPDRTRPHDFEVHSVTRVAGLRADSDVVHELKPRYVMGAEPEQPQHLRYAVERRVARATFTPQRRGAARSSYPGSEVFVSLIEPRGAGAVPGASLQQLSVHALCTNRDLPLSLSLGQGGNDFEVRSGVPADSVRCVTGLTSPRMAPLDGATAWRLLSHLSVNYLSLSAETGGAEPLRELLRSYGQLGDPMVQRQVDGVCAVQSSCVVGPMPGPGPRSFVRGLEIHLECEEQAFSGHGVFTLASVLSAFFARHASAHSFAQTVLRTRERGEVHRWAPVAGLQPVL